MLPVTCHLYFVNLCACGGYSGGVGGRWAGSWGIEADFVAKTKCSIMNIKAADVQVELAKLQLVLSVALACLYRSTAMSSAVIWTIYLPANDLV